MRYWLFKTEPGSYSIDDLARDGTEPWDGIRNYQVRNFMRDDMKVGDRILFYHSNAKPTGVVGTATVASPAYADPTAFDPSSKYYDEKSDPANPRWLLVDVRFGEKFDRCLTLEAMRSDPFLEDMALLRKGQRLSVLPVEAEHFHYIVDAATAAT